jgi:outer membrane lipoprotein LolB
LILMSGVALLSACSTLPVSRTSPELESLWMAQQQSLGQFHSWLLSGRLAVQTENQGWNVSVRWQQDAGTYHIVLSAPLGQGTAELQGDSQGMTLSLANGRSMTSVDPEELLFQQMGWRVPVTGLRYWVIGLPVPDTAETHALDEDGRLQWLEQSGWRISYRRYGEFSGKALPTKIFLDNRAFKVRLVVDEWILS